jgi:serine/threonine-protein kinase
MAQFGKYQLLERLAVGGMAEVFRARAVGAAGFEKDIAIKRILPQYSEDENFVRMFIDEARLAAQLQHSNIVQIFDFDQVEGSYYIAMELVDGCDLRRLQQRRRLPVQVSLYVAVQTLKGLHYAHTKAAGGQPLGIVHRDVSPQNILLSQSGEVKLSDFGIAKARARASSTSTGVIKGKICYMSPEQAAGRPLDHRTDLFAVGVVLFESLTGKQLFDGDSEMEMLSLVQRCVIPPPRQVNRDIPPEVDATLLALLAQKPDDRPADASEASRALSSSALYVDDPEPLAKLVCEIASPRPSARPSVKQSNLRASGKAVAAPLPPRPAAPPAVTPVGAGMTKTYHGAAPASPPMPTPVGETKTDVASAAPPRSPLEGRKLQRSQRRSISTPAKRRSGGLGILVLAVVVGSGAALALWALVRPKAVLRSDSLDAAAPQIAQSVAAPSPKLPVAPEVDAAAPMPKTAAVETPKTGDHRSHGSRKRAAESTAPTGEGYLSVYVRPWAMVNIDGKPIQQTPVIKLPLLAGHHVIDLVRTDHEPPHHKRVSATITAGGHLEVREELE